MHKAIIHPLLFALFPIAFLLQYNLGEVILSRSYIPTIITLSFTLLFLILLKLITKSTEKAAIICSIFLIFFFSYGHIYDSFAMSQIGKRTVLSHGVTIPIWLSLFAIIVYFVSTNKRIDLSRLTSAFNVVALILFVSSVFPIAVYEVKDLSRLAGKEGKSIELIASTKQEVMPDIYYIILDGYASSSTLKECYGYDNSEFEAALKRKGFYIATRSHSNYPMTPLSLASSLNMKHVNYLSGKYDPKVTSQMIKYNEVARYLKSKGYKFVHISSGYWATKSNEFADIDIQPKGLNRFSMLILNSTMLKPLARYFIANSVRDHILCAFDTLADVPNIKGPKFVFAHMITPHPPYIFDQDGEPIRDPEIGPSVFTQIENMESGSNEQYLNQLIFISKKVEWLVGEILLKSDVEPIIILQSDHGPDPAWPNGVKTWNEAAKESRFPDNLDKEALWFIRGRVRIFNAYHMPNSSDNVLYESITPINTFRLTFNQYFDSEFHLLDDKTYFSSYSDPYKFLEIPVKILYD